MPDLLDGTGTHTEFHQWELRICNTELQTHIHSTALQPKSYNIGMRSIGVLLCLWQVVAFVQARAAACLLPLASQPLCTVPTKQKLHKEGQVHLTYINTFARILTSENTEVLGRYSY
jgi:hypothetical protein